MSAKKKKVNKLLKSSIILTLINIFLYIPPMFLKINNQYVQKEIEDANILKANFTKWIPNETLENNVFLIIFLTSLVLSLIFFILGLFKHKTKKTQII